jgi:6-phosphofructokinase 2
MGIEPAGQRVVTVTLNPAIDLALSVERVAPVRKMRAGAVRRTPGGGGVNVARGLARLGAPVTALFFAGGAEGDRLCRMLAAEGVGCLPAPIAGETRESFNVLETSTGLEFRFVLPGPEVTENDVAALEARLVAACEGAAVVISGSLPPGVPADTYARLARAARGQGSRQLAATVALDASGEALRGAIGAADLVKPSLEELADLVGRPLMTIADRRAACGDLVARHGIGTVALSMGAEGAMLVTDRAALAAPALPLPSASAVGAGDQFLAGLVWARGQGCADSEALALAIAAPAVGLTERTGSPADTRAALLALAGQVAVQTL